MGKDITHKNTASCLKRTKVIFFVIAVAMCLSVFAMSYKFTSRGVYSVSSNGVTVRTNTANPTNEIREQLESAKKLFSEEINKKLDKIIIKDIDVREPTGDVLNNTGTEHSDEDMTFSSVMQSSPSTLGTSVANVDDRSKVSININGYHTGHSNGIVKRNDTKNIEPIKKDEDVLNNPDVNIKTGLSTPARVANKISLHNTSGAIRSKVGVSKKRFNTYKSLRQHLIQLGGLRGIQPNRKLDIVETSNVAESTVRPDICAGCFKLDFKAMINEPQLCDGNVKLLMLITSKISNADGRNAVRDTWGAVCNKPTSEIKCLFLFGNRNNSEENQALLKEHQTYHDIYQCDFYDVYANLTYKTMMGLQWAIQHCPQAGYIMKTDDDMYVNTELLPIMLEGAPDKKFMGGNCWGPSSPHRDTNSKWYVSFEQYTHPFFPRMCSGTGYVMSHDVAVGVVKMSADIPFFYLEDVFVAICLKKLGFQPVMIIGFNNMLVDFEPCKYRNRILTTHGVNANSLIIIWKRLKMCPKEDLAPSMVYRFRSV